MDVLFSKIAVTVKVILFIGLIFLPALALSQKFNQEAIRRSAALAKSVAIIRDNCGIPHIYGEIDVAVVFWVDEYVVRREFILETLNVITGCWHNY